MKYIIRTFAAAVTRFPWALIAGAIVLTGVFGYLGTGADQAAGQEGFAPDNPEIDASETIAELFGEESSDTVMQVMVVSENGDVLSADGLVAVTSAIEGLQASDVAGFLASEPFSFLAPVQFAAQAQSIPLDGLGDEQIKQIYEQALDNPDAPAELSFASNLVADKDGDGRPEAGMMLVNVSAAGGEAQEAFDAQIAREQAIADAVSGVEVPDGIEIRPFSFTLLFGDEFGFDEELARLFASAFGIIIAILVFVYWVKPTTSRWASIRRALADTGVTMLTIVMAITWMQGIGALFQDIGWVGPLSEVAQIVPVLLIGLGVDYGIHLISRYREEVGGGEPVAGGIRRAIGTSGVALTLATVTTMIGFLTNVFNPVPALKDFGILAAVGIFASFFLMLTFVPALRLVLDSRGQAAGRLQSDAFRSSSEERILPRVMERTAVLAERFAVPTLLVTLALGGLGYYGLTQLETRFSFTDFLPDDNPLVETYTILQEQFGGGFGETTQVLVEAGDGVDLATPELFNALATLHSDLVGVDDVLTVSTSFGEFAQVTDPVTVFQQLTSPAQGGDPALAAEAMSLGMDADGSVSESADVSAIFELATTAAPDQMGRVLHRADDGTVDAIVLQIGTQAGESRAGELRETLIAALGPISEMDGVNAIPTSSEIISDVVVNALSDSQVSSLLYTVLAATVVLIVSFWFENRRPFLGVLTMIPVALVVLWTFGLMYVSDIPFGPVTATLAALAVGIGVPYTIHLARRFEEDRNRFSDIEEAIRSTTRHTGGALAGSAFTTAAGFGILVTSTLTPFRQMGQVTAYAIALSLAGSVLVLPSLLVLWERYHRRKGDIDQAPATTSAV